MTIEFKQVNFLMMDQIQDRIVCTKVLENKDFVQPVAKDFTKEALNFISSIKIMNQYQPLGTVISFLMGSVSCYILLCFLSFL